MTTSDQATILKRSIWLIQLVNGFQLVKIWATTSLASLGRWRTSPCSGTRRSAARSASGHDPGQVHQPERRSRGGGLRPELQFLQHRSAIGSPFPRVRIAAPCSIRPEPCEISPASGLLSGQRARSEARRLRSEERSATAALLRRRHPLAI